MDTQPGTSRMHDNIIGCGLIDSLAVARGIVQQVWGLSPDKGIWAMGNTTRRLVRSDDPTGCDWVCTHQVQPGYVRVSRD